MQLFDRLTLDGPRRDSAGNLIASVLAARTGIQDYAGYEVGKPEMAHVRIYRPAEEVFSRDSMRSFAGAPVTIEHPPEMVTPANWKDHAVGETSEEIVRDGEAVRVPFLLRDAGGIASVESGKREISMGYTCDLDWAAGTSPTGEAYDAIQRDIRINHLAIVDNARGGPTLRIGDSKMPHVLIIDGLQVPNVSDEAKAAIEKLQGQITVLTTDKAASETKLGELTATVQTKDGEIAALNAKLADAELTPAQKREAGRAYAKVCDDAKRIVPTLQIADDAEEKDIKRAAVAAKLGDRFDASMSDAAVAGAFAVLLPAAPAGSDPIVDAIAAGGGSAVSDSQKIRDLAHKNMIRRDQGLPELTA